MIKVLIINDSRMIQEHIKRIIATDPECELAGIANDGFEGFELVKQKSPDVILMDIQMPGCDGSEATLKIMKAHPTPLIIVTATITKHMTHIYDCMANGALEVVKTPASPAEGHNLLNRIKIANSLKPKIVKLETGHAHEQYQWVKPPSDNARTSRKIVAIGASTGGPSAVAAVLKALPPDLNAALIIVQHIDAEFVPSLAEWFDKNCSLRIQPARANDRIINGTGLLVSRNEDLVVERGYTVNYQRPSGDAIYSPSINVTFKSVAEAYGRQAIGVILTGMGSDGAAGLKAMRDAGARTIAQDEASSLIYGMPKSAVELQAAEFVLPLNEIAGQIVKLLQ